MKETTHNILLYGFLKLGTPWICALCLYAGLSKAPNQEIKDNVF